MKPLYFDIETIPNIDPVKYAETIEITPPSNYKKHEAIDNYIAKQRVDMVDKITKDASLNPVYGRVISAAIRYDGETYSCCSDDEHTVLDYVDEFFSNAPISWASTQLVTFNGKAFDIPFFTIRYGLNIFPTASKYDQSSHMDVYLYLSNFGAFRGSLSMSQAAIADMVGLEPVSGHGSEVYGFYKDGNFDAIKKHNEDDVEQLEKICNHFFITSKSESIPM